jgi:hypothetical protein
MGVIGPRGRHPEELPLPPKTQNSFQSADYAANGGAKARAQTALRRYVWNPVMTVLELPEYPILRLTKRGISLCFTARLPEGSGVGAVPGKA